MRKMMNLNPEFARNLWLEISVQRLIIAPVILLLVCVLILLNTSGSDSGRIIHYMALGGFVFFCMIWGLRSASDSVLDEYNEKTWDWQKMSIIGAWKLAWGKLLGSTIYQWYVAGICLLLYFISSFDMKDPMHEFEIGLILIILAISIHGLMILLSLLMMRRGDGKSKIKSTKVFIIGLFLVFGLIRPISMGFLSSKFYTNNFQWYGLQDVTHIILISSVFYCIWIIAGLYRSMRSELQFTDKPTWWITFLCTNILFIFGFMVGTKFTLLESISLCLVTSFFQTLVLSYFLALTESKDIVAFRSLIKSYRSKDWDNLFNNIALWQVTLMFSFIVGLLALIASIASVNMGSSFINLDSFDGNSTLKFIMGFLAILGFVIRDLSILMILNFSQKSKRADAAMMLYLVVLYALLPAMTFKLGIGAAFFPDITGNPFLMAGLPIIEAGIALYILREKWKSIETVKNVINPLTA